MGLTIEKRVCRVNNYSAPYGDVCVNFGFTQTPSTRALITVLRSRSGAKSLLLLLVGSVLLLVALLNKGEADALGLGKGDQGLLGLTDDENVGQTGGEGVAAGVLDVGNLVRTGMVLDVLEDTNTADVVTAGNEDGGAVVELDDRVNFVGLEVKLDGVVLLDVGVGETDGAAVVGNNVWHLVLAEDLAEEHRHGDALTELVGALGGTGCVNTAELVKAPVGGGEHALQVLLGSSCHLVLMI